MSCKYQHHNPSANPSVWDNVATITNDRPTHLVQLENVRLKARMKREAPGITLVILATQTIPYSVAFDNRAGKLHSDNVRLIAGMKGEAPNTTLAISNYPAQTLQCSF